MKSEALLTAIKKAGGVAALAKQLNITQSAVSQWRTVPSHRVIEVERLTEVPRGELRPDLYPTEGQAA